MNINGVGAHSCTTIASTCGGLIRETTVGCFNFARDF